VSTSWKTVSNKTNHISYCRLLRSWYLTVIYDTTRLNAFTRSCLFNASAFARRRHRSREPLLADGWSQKFAMFLSYRSSAFMGQSSQNFPRLYSNTGTVYRKSLTGGYSRIFWENRQKQGIFALVHAKARTVFASGGQRSRLNVHLCPLSIERTL